MKGHAGFVAIAPDYGVVRPYQAIPVESETLGVKADIKYDPDKVQGWRGYSPLALASGPLSPAGEITLPLRTDDSIALLFSHFQACRLVGESEGTFEYEFFPSTHPPAYNVDPAYSDYGEPNGIFTVSVLKKFFNKAGTNTQWFKRGIADQLGISCAAGQYARIGAALKFQEVDYGTDVGTDQYPGAGTIGSYSSGRTFEGFRCSVDYAGQTFDVDSFQLTTKNGLEPIFDVGAKNVRYFAFRRFEIDGAFSLDMPYDGLKYFGSMIGTQQFSVNLLLDNEESSVEISMPFCMLKPFESNVTGEEDYRLQLGFRALGYAGTSAITLRVFSTTEIEFYPEVLDAWYGAREEAFAEYDAGLGARTIGEYTIFDRDL